MDLEEERQEGEETDWSEIYLVVWKHEKIILEELQQNSRSGEILNNINILEAIKDSTEMLATLSTEPSESEEQLNEIPLRVWVDDGRMLGFSSKSPEVV